MTNAISFQKNPNPLFDKMCSRFSYGKDKRTIGEFMMEKAMEKEQSVSRRHSATENHITRGNNLPRAKAEKKEKEKNTCKTHRRSLPVILLSALCALLLSGIVFAAVSNYLLQKKMDRLEDHYEAALRVKQSNEIASDVSVLGPGNGYTIGGAFSDDACESTNA